MQTRTRTSRRSFLTAASFGAVLAGGALRVASAEGIAVQAYGARIDLATGAVTQRPGIDSRGLTPTGSIVVGSSRFDAVAQRTHVADAGTAGYAGTVTVEEHDAKSGTLLRSWRVITHPRFYDRALIELHAEKGAVVVDVHFVTYM